MMGRINKTGWQRHITNTVIRKKTVYTICHCGLSAILQEKKDSRQAGMTVMLPYFYTSY